MYQHPSQTTCPYCHGRDGRNKRTYASEYEARDTAAHVRGVRGVTLRAYRCSMGCGWHLTSDTSGGW